MEGKQTKRSIREKRFTIRFTDYEAEQIQKRASIGGYGNTGAFIRKMALDGLNVKIDIDLSEIRKIRYLVSTATNNINQVARKANETGAVYTDDIKELSRQTLKIEGQLLEIQKHVEKQLTKQADKIEKLLKDSGYAK